MLSEGSSALLKVAPAAAAAAATDVQTPAHRTGRDGNINTLHLRLSYCFMSLKHRALTLDVILTHFFNLKNSDNVDVLTAFTFRLQQ